MPPRAPNWAGRRLNLGYQPVLLSHVPMCLPPLRALFKDVEASSYARGRCLVRSPRTCAVTWPVSSKPPIVKPEHPINRLRRRTYLARSPTNASAPSCWSCDDMASRRVTVSHLIQSAAEVLPRTSTLGSAVPLCHDIEAEETHKLGRATAWGGFRGKHATHIGAPGDRGPGSGFQPGPDEVVE